LGSYLAYFGIEVGACGLEEAVVELVGDAKVLFEHVAVLEDGATLGEDHLRVLVVAEHGHNTGLEVEGVLVQDLGSHVVNGGESLEQGLLQSSPPNKRQASLG
jgi:hypothetical protein